MPSQPGLISYSATFAVGFLLSLYLQYIKGLEPDQAGLVLLLQPLVLTSSRLMQAGCQTG
jgi:hypothetical protein